MANRLAPDARERFRCDGFDFGHPVVASGRAAASRAQRGAMAMRNAILFGKVAHAPPGVGLEA